MNSPAPLPPLGLVAGHGTFPLELAAKLATRFRLEIVAVRTEASAEIEHYSPKVTWLQVGRVQAMIDTFKRAGVREVIMAGKVQKLHLFRNFLPDIPTMRTLAALPDRRDDTLMNGVAGMLADHGITMISQLKYAAEMLASAGHLMGPTPNARQQKDVAFGCQHAKGIAALDIGQTVVVQQQAVLAVEAIEGTDAAIVRGGALGSGLATVAKVAKPNQDLRFDVPAFGADTLMTMRRNGCDCLAVEAGLTLMLQRDRLATLAEEYGITVVGVDLT
ncbi:MAG: UDP-2,3-diacylglucosamine diphosphatase LpxI [Mariprofundales bacterium]|nr:UDP-2,3-diacylglucosamine diphosphatase LpxI [Mariprofundales bacterium]